MSKKILVLQVFSLMALGGCSVALDHENVGSGSDELRFKSHIVQEAVPVLGGCAPMWVQAAIGQIDSREYVEALDYVNQLLTGELKVPPNMRVEAPILNEESISRLELTASQLTGGEASNARQTLVSLIEDSDLIERNCEIGSRTL